MSIGDGLAKPSPKVLFNTDIIMISLDAILSAECSLQMPNIVLFKGIIIWNLIIY